MTKLGKQFICLAALYLTSQNLIHQISTYGTCYHVTRQSSSASRSVLILVNFHRPTIRQPLIVPIQATENNHLMGCRITCEPASSLWLLTFYRDLRPYSFLK